MFFLKSKKTFWGKNQMHVRFTSTSNFLLQRISLPLNEQSTIFICLHEGISCHRAHCFFCMVGNDNGSVGGCWIDNKPPWDVVLMIVVDLWAATVVAYYSLRLTVCRPVRRHPKLISNLRSGCVQFPASISNFPAVLHLQHVSHPHPMVLSLRIPPLDHHLPFFLCSRVCHCQIILF